MKCPMCPKQVKGKNSKTCSPACGSKLVAQIKKEKREYIAAHAERINKSTDYFLYELRKVEI